ncbi:MAG: hypothetical protein IJ682_13000 [Lachnospiraceae bacterium]|nr:hypothetical protein [Lachnospiraceae bacterium]
MEKQISLANKKTNTKRTYLLRTFRPGDERGIISCVKEEHGDTYFKKYFYDKSLLREKALGGEYVFFVAEETGGEKKDFEPIAGIEILRLFTKNGDDYIEPASQMIRKRHRGFHLSEALVEYTFYVAKSIRPSALFVHTAMYHSITQHVCESYGMVPVGFEIGSFLAEVMQNSFVMEGIKKYSAGTLCYPVEKKNAGDVYLPAELKGYAGRIYEALGATCHILTEDDMRKEEQKESTHTSADNNGFGDHDSLIHVSDENGVNNYITINVLYAGDDLYERIKEIMDAYLKGDSRGYTKKHVQAKNGVLTNPEAHVFHLILDIDTPKFFKQYQRLKEMGFFFGSMQPLCGEHERVFLYWVGDIELHMEDYRVTDKFSVIRDRINGFYKERGV